MSGGIGDLLFLRFLTPPMLGLWLLTAHLTADFPLQPDWMAKGKLDDPSIRAQHVLTHLLVTAPILVFAYGSTAASATAILWIGLSHYVIDSYRWVEPKDGWGHDGKVWVWLNDQIMHLVALSLVPFAAAIGFSFI